MAKNCVKELTERFKDIPPKDIQAIVDELDKIKFDKDFAAKAKNIRRDSIFEKNQRAEQKLRDAVATMKMTEFIEKPDFKGDPQQAFLAKFQGVDFLTEGGNFNFMQIRHSFRDRFLNMLRYGIDDLAEVSADGKMDVDIANAVDRLNKGESITDIHPEVVKIAKTIKSVNKNLVDGLKDSGVVIKERNDYITRQSHNRDKIQEAGFDDWFQDVSSSLDATKTFGAIVDEADQQRILRGIFDDIIETGVENNVGNFGGKRTLHFKDGTSWAQYNSKYGHGTLLDSIVATINSSSKAAASAQVFGTSNGRQLWKDAEAATIKRLAESGDEKALGKFSNGSSLRRGYEAEMFGHEQHHGTDTWAKWQRRASLVQSASLLGKAVFSTLTDLSFSSFNFRAATGSRGFAEFDAMKSFFKVIPDKEFDFWSKSMDMYYGDMLGETFDRFGGFVGGGKSGSVEKFLKWSTSLSGLNFQSSRAKVANARLFSIELGKNHTRGFSELEPRLRAGLERFGIDEPSWKIMRDAIQEYDNGLVAITPESIGELPRLRSSTRNNLRIKVASYLADMAKVGSPESSGRERALITQGTSPNTPLGAFLRTAGQFKSFSLAVPRALRRIALSNPAADGRTILSAFRNMGDGSLLAGTLTEATLLAGAGVVAKNALKGKETKFDENFLLQSVTEGAMPLMFSYTLDAMKGEYNKYGRSFLKDLAGPTLGQLDDVTSLLGSASGDIINVLTGQQRGDSKAAQKAVRLIMRNAPGQNLPLVKPMLNKLFLTDFMEYLNPGHGARIQNKAARDGTEFLFNPY